MSIIIRLQNLPLSARSGEIRNFFGGLRIPDGGVHILGGDKGDAFIAFMSDEDARLAMRKDGGRIKDARVKLFLSSRMEMHHEVEKITKNNTLDALPHKSKNVTRSPEASFRSRSSERRRRSCSRNRSPDLDKERDFKSRGVSPIIYNARSSLRYRSRSPRRSISPMRSVPSQRPALSKSRKITQRKRSISPKAHGQFAHQIDKTINKMPSVWVNSDYHNQNFQFPSQTQLQSELEKRIAQELKNNIAFGKNLGVRDHRESNLIPTSNIIENMPHRIEESYQQGSRVRNLQDDMIFPHSSANKNMHHFQDDTFKEGNNTSDSFYITMTGLEPDWDFREVQVILKGIFAPQYNMRWEKVNGFKSGIVFVKLNNKEDFDNVLQKSVFHFENRRISVKECHRSVAHKYFRHNSDIRDEHYILQDCDLCYMLKGLPFSCTYDDVIKFFHGFEVADIQIFYGEDGRATGTGFVSFAKRKDFQGAMMQNGKKIGHRYIEMLPSTVKEMSEAKEAYSGGSFVPYSKILSQKNLLSSRRPLCALLTGLPLNTKIKDISSFFSESDLKPTAIHLTLNKKKLSDGKAFVEFTNFLDFDLALKFHGKFLNGNIICVKQILYDELVKILDSQKAKHHFQMPESTSYISNEPEKVPYLWEPPDEEQEKIDNSGIWARDHRVGISNPNNKVLENPSNVRPKRYFDPHFNQNVATNAVTNIFQNNTQLGASNVKGKFGTDNSMQFNLHKLSTKNPTFNETFRSTKKYEENIKSSRLSPENEAALLDFLNKDRKPSADSTNIKRGFKRGFKPGSINRKGRVSRFNNDEEYDLLHRSSVQSDPLRFENNRRSKEEDSSKGCVVQLSNVHQYAESLELLSFLSGFDFYEETLIRRYTAEGAPTPDVRVTFHNRKEAERAIKFLNKTYLQEKIVSMCIV